MTSETIRSLWNTEVSLMIQASVSGDMPTEVPFVKIALSEISLFKISGFSKSNNRTLQFVRSFKSATVFSARAKKSSRTLNTEISDTPSSAACTKIAVAAPPAPSSVIFLPMML